METVHGYNFELDNADWQSQADAQLLYDRWLSNMKRLSAKTIQQAHADYMQAKAEGEDALCEFLNSKKCTSQAWVKVQNCADRAAASIFKNYSRDSMSVLSGHNYSVDAAD